VPLRKQLNALKREQFPWTFEVTKYRCKRLSLILAWRSGLFREADRTFEEELAQDVIEIITVFSAHLYGNAATISLRRDPDCWQRGLCTPLTRNSFESMTRKLSVTSSR